MKKAAAKLPREKVASLDAQAGVGAISLQSFRCEVNRKKSKFECNGLVTTVMLVPRSLLLKIRRKYASRSLQNCHIHVGGIHHAFPCGSCLAVLCIGVN